jgi:hypothetical protein
MYRHTPSIPQVSVVHAFPSLHLLLSTASLGQVALVPVHFSTTSQFPRAARQT